MSKNLFNFSLLVTSVALGYLFISPLYTGTGPVWQPEQGVADLINSNAEYDSALIEIDGLATQSNTLKNQYEGVSPEARQKMGVMVPDAIDPIRLISEVNTVANQTGLTIHDLNYAENKTNSPLRGSYIVSFSVATSYTRFKELMRNYETSLRLFTIKSVVFAAPVVEGDYPTFQVKLETFYMK